LTPSCFASARFRNAPCTRSSHFTTGRRRPTRYATLAAGNACSMLSVYPQAPAAGIAPAHELQPTAQTFQRTVSPENSYTAHVPEIWRHDRFNHRGSCCGPSRIAAMSSARKRFWRAGRQCVHRTPASDHHLYRPRGPMQ
jgi:hypothetical protein